MIESKNDTSKNLEKALQALEQAKQRVANEKKKQNEKKRKVYGCTPLPCRQNVGAAYNVTKQASTRFSIVRRSKGQPAVEKASYISRSILVSEYDGQTYRPKYHEDLVHSEISLPPNAPKEYADRATLWNAVELSEKGQKSQLARMLKASLPTEWSYELAEEIVRDYVQRNFADKGMEQGIDREPTIHIGAVANALERKGIQTERGNINRLAYAEVISYNKKNLERELQNESRQHNRQQNKTKRREEEI